MKHPAPLSKVHTVDADAALEWAAGKLKDPELIACAGGGAVFIEDLPSRRAIFDCHRRIRDFGRRGAFFLIARTGNPVVSRHLEKLGAIATAVEAWGGEVKNRYVLPPAAWQAWLQKVRVKTAGHPRNVSLIES